MNAHDDCDCGTCCLPTIVLERDEAMAELAKAKKLLGELHSQACKLYAKDDVFDAAMTEALNAAIHFLVKRNPPKFKPLVL